MKISRDNNNNVSYTLESNNLCAQQIIDYWTPERKKGAIPIMQGVLCPEDDIGQADMDTTDPEKADLSKMPFSAGGKLFFSIGGKNYIASANIMEKSNLLVTAAHCVQDKETGMIYDNFLFERCYDEGKSSEKLTFKTIALKEYWHTKKDWKWDYAMAVLNTNSSAASPLKYSTDNIENKIITNFGYPANYYNGNKMVFVKGNAARRYDNTWLINGCKMRGGSSGGAWVLEDNETVVGVNSYGPVSESLAYEGSPIFDENFESLYNYVLTLM